MDEYRGLRPFEPSKNQLELLCAKVDRKEPGNEGNEPGNLVLREDKRTLEKRKHYNMVLSTYFIATALLGIGGTVSAEMAIGSGLAEDHPLHSITAMTFACSFFLVIFSIYFFNKSRIIGQRTFYNNGISFWIRYKHRGWVQELRPWNRMYGFKKVDHWILGPCLSIDVGIPGERFLVPDTMEGFSDVEDLIFRNLSKK